MNKTKQLRLRSKNEGEMEKRRNGEMKKKKEEKKWGRLCERGEKKRGKKREKGKVECRFLGVGRGEKKENEINYLFYKFKVVFWENHYYPWFGALMRCDLWPLLFPIIPCIYIFFFPKLMGILVRSAFSHFLHFDRPHFSFYLQKTDHNQIFY